MKTSVKNMLKTDSKKLNATQQKVLQEFMDVEEEAQPIAKKLAGSLKGLAEHEGEDFKESIKKSNLKEEDKTKVTDLFSQLLLKRFEELSDKLYADLKKGEGYLYNAMLSETVIDILDIIQDFKASIDKYLPIPSEEILKMCAPFIMASVAAVAPGIAILLKTTGIIDKAAEFLETKNLTATMDKLKEGLADLRKDKSLEVINKTSELSQATGISATSLNKLGFTSGTLDIANKQVKTTSEVKSFIKEVASYAEKTMSRSQGDIDNKLQAIKKSAIDVLVKANAPKELITKVTNQIDDNFVKVKEQLKPTLDPKVKLFDKITAQENGAKLVLDCVSDVSKTVEKATSKKDVAKNITDNMTKEVDTRLKGDLSKVATHLKHSAVKGFAKEVFGAGHATIIKLEREASVTLSRSGGREK